jgi:hypothetical protein
MRKKLEEETWQLERQRRKMTPAAFRNKWDSVWKRFVASEQQFIESVLEEYTWKRINLVPVRIARASLGGVEARIDIVHLLKWRADIAANLHKQRKEADNLIDPDTVDWDLVATDVVRNKKNKTKTQSMLI